jgi:hypothetical protein
MTLDTTAAPAWILTALAVAPIVLFAAYAARRRIASLALRVLDSDR